MFAEPYAPSRAVDQLPVTTATALKDKGWRRVMADVRREGRLLVTHHDTPQAVILPPEEYERLARLAQEAADRRNTRIEALKMRFRKELECLQEPGVDEIFDKLMLNPSKLGGRVIAGEGY